MDSLTITKFRKQYTDRLLQITAQQKDVEAYEAFRRYQTDAKFRMQVNTLVNAAVQVIESLDQSQSGIQQVFEDEVSLHLGWDPH